MESPVKHKITVHGVNGNVPNVNLTQTRQRPIWLTHLVYCGKTKSGGGIELGMGIWLVPVIEYYFEGSRGEEQKKRGRGCVCIVM